MISVSAKVTKRPSLKLEMPSRTFWTAAAIEAKKRIRQRTETGKKDHNNRAFKPYREEYKILRAKKGRSTTPNLSFTGKMLGAMRIAVTNRIGKVVLSGEEALKAAGNEARGRIFFALAPPDIDAIYKMVDRWLAKKNRLS